MADRWPDLVRGFDRLTVTSDLRERIERRRSRGQATSQRSPGRASGRFGLAMVGFCVVAAIGGMLVIAAHSRQGPSTRSGHPKPPTSHGTRGAPFGAPGGVSGGPGSGLWGDTSSGPNGDQIGCIAGRHYSQTTTLHNRTRSTLKITGVSGKEPAPSIIRRVAVQLRLAPQTSSSGSLVGDPGYEGWSRAPLVPLSVPPGRSTFVQSNFLMQRCDQLRPHQTLIVNRAILVAYDEGQRTGHQRIAIPSAQIILTRGPTIRSCSAPQGAARLDAYDITCSMAQTGAVGCHQLAHGTYGTCTAAGREWDCTFTSASKTNERCWLPSKRQNFAVRWN